MEKDLALRNLNETSENVSIHADVAIVGAGAAGLTIAREFANTRLKVVVVDTERSSRIGDQKAEARADRSAQAFHSFEKSGFCAALGEMDFEKRDWIAESGWPVTRESLVPYMSRAARLMNLGPNRYDETIFPLLKRRPKFDRFPKDSVVPCFWQFSHERGSRSEPLQFGRVARSIRSANVEFISGAWVAAIDTYAGGRRVKAVTLRTAHGATATLSANTIVLCGDAVENARMLLASRSSNPHGLGNDRDVVGRYFAVQRQTVVARFTGRNMNIVARRFAAHALNTRGPAHHYLPGISLSPELQRMRGLLNCAAYPLQEISDDDPWRAMRRIGQHRSARSAFDALDVLRNSHLMVGGLCDRLLAGREMRRKLSQFRFVALAEQEPDPESRITLSHEPSPTGIPLGKIEWRASTLQIESIRELGRQMSRSFIQAGLPEPLLSDMIIRQKASEACLHEAAQTSGTTRMGTSPSTSVVDRNLMVHGVEGLYIVGSSVFPTNGYADPTLTAVALALRLADHIRVRASSNALTCLGPDEDTAGKIRGNALV